MLPNKERHSLDALRYWFLISSFFLCLGVTLFAASGLHAETGYCEGSACSASARVNFKVIIPQTLFIQQRPQAALTSKIHHPQIEPGVSAANGEIQAIGNVKRAVVYSSLSHGVVTVAMP